jgi:hypothetical protein
MFLREGSAKDNHNKDLNCCVEKLLKSLAIAALVLVSRIGVPSLG